MPHLFLTDFTDAAIPFSRQVWSKFRGQSPQYLREGIFRRRSAGAEVHSWNQGNVV